MSEEKIKPLTFRQLFDAETCTYTYLLIDAESNEGILIDPVKEQRERDLKLIGELEVKLKYVLETHVHADHVTGSDDIRSKTEAGVVYGKAANVPCADRSVIDGDELQFGRFLVRVLFTPGHTNGCTTYYVENMAFTGDALFIRGCGRTDFQQGSPETLYESVTQKLFTLPEDTLVYPGHDYKGMSVSTIKEEKRFNPRLGNNKSKEEFIRIMNSLDLLKPRKIDEAVPANLKCGKIT